MGRGWLVLGFEAVNKKRGLEQDLEAIPLQWLELAITPITVPELEPEEEVAEAMIKSTDVQGIPKPKSKKTTKPKKKSK